MKKTIFIDPAYSVFNHNLLFTADDSFLNRDNQLLPYKHLYQYCMNSNTTIYTADYLSDNKYLSDINYYYSMGVIKNYTQLFKYKNLILQDFYILEPPVVAPHLYHILPELTRYFKRVFIHNTEGGGYSLKNVNTSKLKKLFVPQSYNEPIDKYWNNTNRGFLCLINSNIKAVKPEGELYTERIKTIIYFAQNSKIDLYGKGWDKILPNKGRFSRYIIPLNIFHHNLIKSVYKGLAKSKYETLSQYNFAICYENMIMPGYITEKIFDCFVAGSIPIYLGAPDIADYVDREALIDGRDFQNYAELDKYLRSLSSQDIQRYRDAGKRYMLSDKYKPYTKEYFTEKIIEPTLVQKVL